MRNHNRDLCGGPKVTRQTPYPLGHRSPIGSLIDSNYSNRGLTYFQIILKFNPRPAGTKSVISIEADQIKYQKQFNILRAGSINPYTNWQIYHTMVIIPVCLFV